MLNVVQCIDDGAAPEGSEVTDSALSQLQMLVEATEAEFAAKFVKSYVIFVIISTNFVMFVMN